MLTAMPALKSLSFELQELPSRLCGPLTPQDLIAFSQARHLSFLALKQYVAYHAMACPC